MDIIIKNARLPSQLKDQAELWRIQIKNGLIDAVLPEAAAPDFTGQNVPQIDAAGNLVTPPFLEPHLHLDSALSVGQPRYNESSTLLEGIAIWGERKAKLTREEIVKNAIEAVLWEFANGTQFIRTHADVTHPSLLTLEALLEVKEAVRELVDIQIVAFPQDGVFTSPKAEKQLEEALRRGADVVGGIPHIEFTREDGVRQIELVFKLAQKYDALVDVHCDETGDDQSRFLEVLLKEAIVTGLGPRATASHTTAFHNYNNDYALKLTGIAARAGANFIVNPFANAVLQNRTDGYPRRRGVTRVDELDAAGVNVSIGHDCIMDPWYPIGTGSLLQAANLLMHLGHLSGHAQIPRLFEMISANTAITMQVEERYGIAPGKPANLLVLDAKSPAEAIRLMPVCLYNIRHGKVAMTGQAARREINFAGFVRNIDFKLD